METRFTPGPWVVSQQWQGGKAEYRIGVGNDAPAGTILPWPVKGSIDNRADADLISAAPDLYAACEAALEVIRYTAGNIGGTIGEKAAVQIEPLMLALSRARGEKGGGE